MQKQFLKFISDEEFRDIYGIQLSGYRLAIRHSNNESHAPAVTATANVKSQVRHHPPQLQPNMTPSSFRAFVMHWDV